MNALRFARILGRCGPISAVMLGLLLNPAGHAWGQCTPEETARLVAEDGSTGDLFFGFAVAISGNVAVVGTPGDDTAGSDAGATYVYRFNGVTWDEEQKLVASDGSADEEYGRSVAISGDVLIVGAWKDSDNGAASGSAYVYRFDGAAWGLDGKLVASDAAGGDWFGYSVDIDGDVAIVGAWGEGQGGPLSGAAYVYRHNGFTWAQDAKLTASDAAIVDFYGWVVAVDDGVAVVGAIGDDGAAAEGGAVYVYRYNGFTWGDEVKLTASDAAGNDQLGTSLGIDGGRLLAAAWGDDSTSGSVYVFHYDGATWTEETKLEASDGMPNDGFGWSLAFEGGLALIGADDDDNDGNSSGSAYLFRFDGVDWTEEDTLTASDAAADDHFGWAVGLSGDTGIVGAPNNDDTGVDSGSAYVFDLNCPGSGPPPPVPGGGPGTTPMVASRLDALGTQIEVNWDDLCDPAGVKILYGPLRRVSSWAITGAVCAIGNPELWDPVPAGDLWFLLVSYNGAGAESSWGEATAGERNGTTASNTCGSVVKDLSGTCP